MDGTLDMESLFACLDKRDYDGAENVVQQSQSGAEMDPIDFIGCECG